jgi:trimethylamine:corrinoid methyltransferase-like protein
MARAGRRPRRDRAEIGLAQPPFKRLRNPFPPFELVSADQVEAIHAASLQVLAEIGMNFLLPEARAILADAGAAVEPSGPRVRFDPAFVEERIGSAPGAFTLHARNPERSTRIGEGWINFAVLGSAPNVSDLEDGRRMATSPTAADDGGVPATARDRCGRAGAGRDPRGRPGQPFLQGKPYARNEHAFYTPLLSDWHNFETWTEDGALNATQRAHRIWQALLAAYDPPPMDPGVAEELDAFVAGRKEEGGAPS